MTASPLLAPELRASDRFNPILVKEVRQALRGRYFKVLFWLTLLAAVLVGLTMLLSAAASDRLDWAGREYFMAVFACLSAAVHAFTPFWAFLSTSGEWDENTHDLLVLSDLKPRQIVLGKLQSALVQALLYYSTFGPFLVLAFLLNGVDLLAIGVLLSCSAVTCLALTTVGVALGCSSRVKAGRGVLMAIFGIGLAIVWGFSMGMGTQIVYSPQFLRDSEGRIAVAFYLTCALALAGVFFAIAQARLAHEEENGSSALRVISLLAIPLAGAWGAWMRVELGEEEFAWAAQLIAAVVLFWLWLTFFNERGGLGRRTTKHVSPRRWRAWLSIPFLPGGGRAVVLFVLEMGLAVLAAVFALGLHATSADRFEAVVLVAVFYAYLFVYLGLPSAVASRVQLSAKGRMGVRGLTLVFVVVTILGPSLLGLMFGIQKWLELEHALNPIWVLDRLEGSNRHQAFPGLVVLGLCFLLTWALNLRRMVSGAREVLAASRAAAARLQR